MIMTTVTQASLLLSSRFGSGSVESGSRGMPLRRNARVRPSRFLRRGVAAVTDMAPRIGGDRFTADLSAPVAVIATLDADKSAAMGLLGEPGDEGFDADQELTWSGLVPVMAAVH
jgi:hypothetical protein